MGEQINLCSFQREVGHWHRDMFPNAMPVQVILKGVEAMAELAAAHNHRMVNRPLPFWQHGLSPAEQDAIGDVAIALAALCDRAGFDFGAVVSSLWAEVKARSAERVKRNSRVADSYEDVLP